MFTLNTPLDPRAPASAARGLVLALTLTASASLAFASDLTLAAVYAWAAKDYQRPVQANGQPAREYYAISNGGVMPGTVLDPAVAVVPFSELAGAVAQHLGRQNYFLAHNAQTADLLLVIHWGTTVPFQSGAEQMAEQQISRATGQLNSDITQLRNDVENAFMEYVMLQSIRQRALLPTAQLLGYVGEIAENDDIRRHFSFGSYHELMTEVAEPRYYIFVSAYDFRRAVSGQEAKLLWQTRISLPTWGLRFRDHFDDMLASGVRYFGKDNNNRLVRRFLRDVRVDIGAAQVVGIVGEGPTPRTR